MTHTHTLIHIYIHNYDVEGVKNIPDDNTTVDRFRLILMSAAAKSGETTDGSWARTVTLRLKGKEHVHTPRTLWEAVKDACLLKRNPLVQLLLSVTKISSSL